MKVFKVFLVAGLIFSFSVAFAQMPGGNRSQMGGQNMNMGHFYGKVLETTTGKPLSAASIQLIQNKFDSVSKKRKDVIVGQKRQRSNTYRKEYKNTRNVRTKNHNHESLHLFLPFLAQIIK